MISLNILLKLLLSSYLILLHVSGCLAGDGRIVGGYSTTIDEAPYLVQIKNNGLLICGGALVTKRHVVTAAHCFMDDPQNLLIVGGATKVTEAGTAQSKVSGYIKHKNFTKAGYDMDIAVIKLKKPLVGDLIKPISLDCDSEWKDGEKVKLFGWGQLNEKSDSVPINLQTVEVNVINKKKCARNYRFQRKFTESMVCASAPQKDSCSGDSGGPAIINKQFCGVVSWGTGCGQEDAPGVYTNMEVVRNFVKAAIKKFRV